MTSIALVMVRVRKLGKPFLLIVWKLYQSVVHTRFSSLQCPKHYFMACKTYDLANSMWIVALNYSRRSTLITVQTEKHASIAQVMVPRDFHFMPRNIGGNLQNILTNAHLKRIACYSVRCDCFSMGPFGFGRAHVVGSNKADFCGILAKS